MQGGDFNLYENMRCHGVPLVTISRGRVVYENGVFMCAEGTGKFCPLRSFPDTVYKKLVQREKVSEAGSGAHALLCLTHASARAGLALVAVLVSAGLGKGSRAAPATRGRSPLAPDIRAPERPGCSSWLSPLLPLRMSRE